MTILDAYPLIAWILDEPAANDVADILKKQNSVQMSSVNLAEVIDVIGRTAPKDYILLDQSLSLLTDGSLEIITADEDICRLAGSLRVRYYQRGASPLSLADCIALATCIRTGGSLVTA